MTEEIHDFDKHFSFDINDLTTNTHQADENILKENLIMMKISSDASTKQKDHLKNNENISIDEKETQDKQKKTFSEFNKITTKIKDRVKKKKSKDKAVSENETNTIQKMKEFKKRLSTIEYEFTLYILKKMKAREKKRSKDFKQTFEMNSNITNLRNLLLKEESFFKNNDVFNNTFIKNFNEYVASKKHKRKIITKNIATRNSNILRDVFYDERLNDDDLIDIKLRIMFKKVR